MLDRARVSRDFVAVVERLDARGVIRVRECATVTASREVVLVPHGAGLRSTRLSLDALVVVEGTGGPGVLVLEVDVGTVSSARMRRRYEALLWWHAARDAGAPLRVVTVCADPYRLARLRASAAHLWLRDAAHPVAPTAESALWFATGEAIEPHDPGRLLRPLFYPVTTRTSAAPLLPTAMLARPSAPPPPPSASAWISGCDS
jgi:hypothetical protein